LVARLQLRLAVQLLKLRLIRAANPKVALFLLCLALVAGAAVGLPLAWLNLRHAKLRR
jgi:hypothetical protein